MSKAGIHIGTSGWSYSDWKELIYPKQLKSTEWLSHYATIFNTTEINSSFYHMTKAQTAVGWAAKVPAGFRFCPKMSKYLTHNKRLKEPEEPLERFFNTFNSIKEQLGPVLMQLPPSLSYDEPTALRLFQLLSEEYKQYRFALEARHASWMEPEAVALMKHYKICLVIAQSGVGYPYTEELTTDIVYLRLHGPGKLYATPYSDEALRDYARKLSQWHREGKELWMFFNNTMHGHGYFNALKLRELISM